MVKKVEKNPITPEDFIFSVSANNDGVGTVTTILHVDVKGHPKFRFNFPLTSNNAIKLRDLLNSLKIRVV